MPKHVILAPHFDDATIDCWYVIRHQPDAVVMTVCAKIPDVGVKTLWDTVCGIRDSNRLVKTRIKENAEALAISGQIHPEVHLDYFDSQYDNSPVDIDQMCKDILANSPKDAIFLAPLAISKIFQHKNHKDILKAGIKLHRDGYKVQFYPDSPYITLPRQPNPRILNNLKVRAEEKLGIKFDMTINNLTDSDVATKKAALKAYKTQYNPTNINSFGGLTRVNKRKYELLFTPS